MNKNGYPENEMCIMCRGKCCKTMGCHFSPDDFANLSFVFLKNEIAKDFISIDWWEGDPRPNGTLQQVYFLRIRNKNANIIDPSWGGFCCLLTDSGCSLKFEERPKSGRFLESKGDYNSCISHYTKKDSAIDWIPHQNVLEKLIETLE